MPNLDVKTNNNVAYICNFHVVFCPKFRRAVLTGDVARRFKEIAADVATEHSFVIEEMEVMPDHIHMLLSVDPQWGIHRAVKAIKGRSSRLLRQEFPKVKSRIPTLWTNSYFVATVGGAPLHVVKKYIEDQKNV